jgi:hypothetical protein
MTIHLGARTPAELDQCHQALIQIYDTMAHQGLLHGQRIPPIPVEVLGTAMVLDGSTDAIETNCSMILRTSNKLMDLTGSEDSHGLQVHLECLYIDWRAGRVLRGRWLGQALRIDVQH